MEEFLPGDKVEFIDDNSSGKVISIIDKSQLMIELEEGLEIPVQKDDIIKVSSRKPKPESLSEKYKEDATALHKPISEQSGIQLAVINEHDNLFSFHLINDTSKFIYFTFYEKSEKNEQAVTKGELKSFEHSRLTNLDISKFDTLAEYELQILIFDQNASKIPEPIIYSFKPKGKNFINQNTNAPLINQKAYLISIDKKSTKVQKTIIKQKQDKPSPPQNIHKIDKPSNIIDLHIEKINPNYEIMSKREIFDSQFNYFINSLEKAIALNFEKIVFIHGIGVSSLKNKITDYLNKNENIKEVKDADIRTFGFGATEVIFSK